MGTESRVDDAGTPHDPAETALVRFGLLASLYLSQGLPFGFFTQALPVLLRQRGASLPEIGLANLLALPWVLKFLWAPLVDRRAHGRFGRRRGFILPIQAAACGVLLAVAAVDPTRGMAPVLVAVLVVNLLAASQDIATDALAVDLLRPADRGLGNGIQVGAYRLGMIIGGGALLMFFDTIGWTRSFLAMAAILAIATLPLVLWREPVGPRHERQAARVDWAALGDWWRHSDTAAWMLLLALYKFGEAMGGAMVRPMMVDAGLGLGDVGFLMGTIGSTMGLLGALAGGVGARIISLRGALFSFGVLQALTILAYAWVAIRPSYLAFQVLCAGEHFVGGMATVALFTAMMDACRPERAATDYTLQACVVVGATGLAASGSGFIAERIGYPMHFLVSGALCGVGVLLTAVYRSREGDFVPRPSRT